MKLTELHEVISTYKMCASEFLSWWHRVRSISWPLYIYYKSMRKYVNAPVSHRRTETTQFFQDHDHSRHLWWSGCNWWSGVTWRSSEVTWGHNPFFANNSRQDGDTDTQMVPNDLDRQAASKDMHIDLIGPWPALDLDLRSNFEIDLSRSNSTCSEPARRGEHVGIIFIFISLIHKKVINEIPSP